MVRLFNSINHPTYTSDELIGKHLYFSKTIEDSTLYYIFTVSKINNTGSTANIQYICSKVYLFMVPDDKSRKAFLYDSYKDITVNGLRDILYEMTFGEFVNTFRVLVQNDGKYVSDLPDKIIQDD